MLVSVTNTGDGIPPDDLPHVFERFYRVEKSRDRARGGAGIGLAIVRQLVEAAGGAVGAESRDGLTRFWFSVPVSLTPGGERPKMRPRTGIAPSPRTMRLRRWRGRISGSRPQTSRRP